MKRQNVMNFDEAGSVRSIGGIEIEAACLASETPSLTQNGLAFLADQLPIPFTRPMHAGEKSAFERFGDVIVRYRLGGGSAAAASRIADAINFNLSGRSENSVQTSSVP